MVPERRHVQEDFGINQEVAGKVTWRDFTEKLHKDEFNPINGQDLGPGGYYTDEVHFACEENYNKVVDLRSFMLDTPYVALSTDKLQKVVDLFRQMHLRQLPVITASNGRLAGIITRKDLFSRLKN